MNNYVHSVLDEIVWFLIRNTEYRSTPDISNQERFESVMAALLGDQGGRPDRPDDALLAQMHKIINDKKVSIRKAAQIVIDSLSSDTLLERKEASKEAFRARLQRRYKDYALRHPTDVAQTGTIWEKWFDEQEKDIQEAFKLIRRYWP